MSRRRDEQPCGRDVSTFAYIRSGAEVQRHLRAARTNSAGYRYENVLTGNAGQHRSRQQLKHDAGVEHDAPAERREFRTPRE